MAPCQDVCHYLGDSCASQRISRAASDTPTNHTHARSGREDVLGALTVP